MKKKALPSGKSKQRIPRFGPGFDRVVQVCIVVLVGLIAVVSYFSDDIRVAIAKFKTTSAKDDTNVKPHSRSNSSFPNYEEYITYAIENNWNPTDPLEKLNATIQKYSQIYDLNRNDTDKHFDSYVGMLNKEIGFLMEVFKQSSDRQIDLTPAMFLSLEVAQQSIYSIMKHKLNIGTRVITKTNAAKSYAQWIYPTCRELMKFALPSDSMSVNTSHIFLDFDRRINGEHTLLTKAVQYRLYGIISVLAAYSSNSIGDALALAIHNGDDLAAALLIKQDESTGYLLSDPSHTVEDFIQLAADHHYPALKHRLTSSYTSSMETTLSVSERAAKSGAINEKLSIYMDYAPVLSSVADSSTPTTSAEGTQSSISGYDAFTMPRITGTGNIDLPKCQVDRVSLKDLTLERFHRDYVKTNNPVVITVDDLGSAAGDLEVWSLDRLLSKYGSTEVIVSIIPYGTLFGRGEITMTLEEYVQTDKRGMRSFTEQLKALNFTTDQDLRLALMKSALETDLDWRHNLPLYIFSGDKQKLNSRMMNDFIATIKAYGFSDTEEEPSSSPFSRLLQSVSVNDTSSVKGWPKRSKVSQPKNWKFQFFLGPALSGAPLHHHAPAFNFLLQGQKVWTLLPPGRDIYSNLHPLEWLDAGGIQWKAYPYSTDQVPGYFAKEDATSPCELVQKRGEVVYVPRHWTHQVVNQAESVGFAVEIQDYIY